MQKRCEWENQLINRKTTSDFWFGSQTMMVDFKFLPAKVRQRFVSDGYVKRLYWSWSMHRLMMMMSVPMWKLMQRPHNHFQCTSHHICWYSLKKKIPFFWFRFTSICLGRLLNSCSKVQFDDELKILFSSNCLTLYFSGW